MKISLQQLRALIFEAITPKKPKQVLRKVVKHKIISTYAYFKKHKIQADPIGWTLKKCWLECGHIVVIKRPSYLVASFGTPRQAGCPECTDSL